MADKVEKWLQENTERFINNNLDSLDYKSLLRAALADPECNEALNGKRRTREWYAGRYGKLEDWARKVLPEPYCTQFFSCLANGLWDATKDVGKPYMSVGAGRIVPGGYFKLDTAQEQILHDQSERAETAEAQLAAALRDKERLDWILQQGAYNEVGTPAKWFVFALADIHADMRASIDAAMSSSRPPANNGESQ